MSSWHRSDCNSTPDPEPDMSSVSISNALGAIPHVNPLILTTSGQTTMTSTGPFTGHTQPSILIPDCDSLSLLPDGRVLVTWGFGKAAITRQQLKDIEALLSLGAMDKLVSADEQAP